MAIVSRLPGSRPGAAWPWWLVSLAAVLAGLYLRIDQLRSQMLIDDEWHSVRMLVRAGYRDIASHFGLADYCIPLTLYYRWLYDHAMLDEWRMHMPLLLAGIALLFLAPWLMRRQTSPAVRATWVGLLAISPVLVHFSRTARPYALLALLGPLAIVAFRNWRHEGRRGWVPVYAVATVFGGWLHLLSLVFTLWPFVHYGAAALLDAMRESTRRRGLHALVAMLALGLVVTLLLAGLLVPPLISDWAAMAGKAGANSVTIDSLYRTLLMQFGIGSASLCAVLFALMCIGIVRFWQRDRDFVVLVLGASLVGLAVISMARPAWIQHAPVLVRYAAPVLPLLLLFVAEGIAAFVMRVREWFAAAVIACALAGLFLAGPMPSYLYRPNQFMGHAIFQFDYDPAYNPYATLLTLGPVPAFYYELAKRPPGSVTLIETPARAISNYSPDPWYQRIHHQNVKYALASPVCMAGAWDEFPYTATGDRFRRMVRLSGILDGATYGANYLVVRLHPWLLPADMPESQWPAPWPDMNACADKVAQRLGEPAFRDDQVVVFALPDASASSASR